MEEMLLEALKTGTANAVTGIPGQALNIGSQALSNYISMRQQRNQTDWYMENYGSPEARMRMMSNAGINPFAAAAGIAGSGGSGSSGPVQAPISSNVGTVSEAGAEATASELNMANADLVRSQKAGQDIQNEITGETKPAVIDQIKALSYIDKYRADHYPEFYTYTMSELDSKIRVNSAMAYYYDKQTDYIDEQIQYMSYMKREVESIIALNTSAKELNEIQKTLTYWNIQIAQKAAERAKISLERYSRSDDAPAWQKKYDEIKEKYGVEAAEEWKNNEFELAQQYNESVAKGQSQGSDPHLASLWVAYDQIETYEDIIDQCNLEMKEANDEVIKALNYGTSEEYLEKQKAYDDLVVKMDQYKSDLEKAKDAFAKGNEFRGYRNPNKFYKDDWIKIGSEIAKDISIIYSASNVGKRSVAGQKGVSGEDIKKGLKNAGPGKNVGELIYQTPVPGNYGMPTISW